MPVNLPLTIVSTSAHKNGIVGYDSDKIYENYAICKMIGAKR